MRAWVIVNRQQQYQSRSEHQSVEEVVETGSWGHPRTVIESQVPVDIFNEADLQAVSFTDTNNIQQTLIPSYNVSRKAISDTAGPTLVPVNSKQFDEQNAEKL